MEPERYITEPLKTWLRLLWLLAKFSIAAIFIVLPIRWFVAQPFLVSGSSMVPTLEQNDYLVIDKLWYQFHEPQRGDVIIMRYPLDSSIFFVKRIVGLPGELVNVSNGIVTIISPDDTSAVLHEPYIVALSGKADDSTTTLTNNEYFVMGDNRYESSDSREWGPLQKKFIVGRAYARLFPFNEVQLLPGRYIFPSEQ